MAWAQIAQGLGIALSLYDTFRDGGISDSEIEEQREDQVDYSFDQAKKTAYMRHLSKLAALNPLGASRIAGDWDYRSNFFRNFEQFREPAFTGPPPPPEPEKEVPESQAEIRRREGGAT